MLWRFCGSEPLLWSQSHLKMAISIFSCAKISSLVSVDRSITRGSTKNHIVLAGLVSKNMAVRSLSSSQAYLYMYSNLGTIDFISRFPRIRDCCLFPTLTTWSLEIWFWRIKYISIILCCPLVLAHGLVNFFEWEPTRNWDDVDPRKKELREKVQSSAGYSQKQFLILQYIAAVSSIMICKEAGIFRYTWQCINIIAACCCFVAYQYVSRCWHEHLALSSEKYTSYTVVSSWSL